MRVTAVLCDCMEPVRLARTIVGFPDPLILLIASRVYRIVHVKNINLSIMDMRMRILHLLLLSSSHRELISKLFSPTFLTAEAHCGLPCFSVLAIQQI